jgi:hypothetical protein
MDWVLARRPLDRHLDSQALCPIVGVTPEPWSEGSWHLAMTRFDGFLLASDGGLSLTILVLCNEAESGEGGFAACDLVRPSLMITGGRGSQICGVYEIPWSKVRS